MMEIGTKVYCLNESETHLVLPKFIIVKELNEAEIKETIAMLDKQNELIEVTQAYNEVR